MFRGASSENASQHFPDVAAPTPHYIPVNVFVTFWAVAAVIMLQNFVEVGKERSDLVKNIRDHDESPKPEHPLLIARVLLESEPFHEATGLLVLNDESQYTERDNHHPDIKDQGYIVPKDPHVLNHDLLPRRHLKSDEAEVVKATTHCHEEHDEAEQLIEQFQTRHLHLAIFRRSGR